MDSSYGLARPTLGDCSWARDAGNECGCRGLGERRSENGNGNLMSRARSPLPTRLGAPPALGRLGRQVKLRSTVFPQHRPSPCSFQLPAPHPRHINNDCAIHQGLGRLLLLVRIGCVLIRCSARRSSASPGNNLPTSLAAPSSPPPPSDQVIHPSRSKSDNN